MKNKARSITAAALFCALLCLSAALSIPAAVPITLQTLVLFLMFFSLGGRASLIVTAVYIAIGAVGLPVFSGMTGGIFRLFDATGGFIFGFIVASLVYLLLEPLVRKKEGLKLVAATLALISLYATGTLWYTLVYLGGTQTLGAALAVTVLPFIIPDVIKLYVAYLISKRIPKP